MAPNHSVLTNIEEAWAEAKPFQIEDAQFVARNKKAVLGHRTGLGKTFITLLAWSLWPDARKALIVGTGSSLVAWYKNLTRWGGAEPIHVKGVGDPNWKQVIEGSEGVYMTTYQTLMYFLRDRLKVGQKLPLDLLVTDEIHKVMRNVNTTNKVMMRISHKYYIGASATWASRGPQDLYPVLHLMYPKTFPSYWRFVQTWCYVENTRWGKEIFGVRNPENLRKMLYDRYFVRRTWKEVGHQFGATNENPVIRRVEIVPMSEEQQRLSDQLRDDMIATLNEEMVVTQNSIVKLLRSLQVAISPRILFSDAGFGGTVEWLMEKVEDDPHTVIFCPFRKGLDVVQEALAAWRYPVSRIFRLQGGTSPADLHRTIEQWKASQGVMLCTHHYAESFDLDTTETAYMLGFDWDPNVNYQAEGRLRRLDSQIKSPALARYIIPQGSEYQTVMDVLEGKAITTQEFLSGRIPRK